MLHKKPLETVLSDSLREPYLAPEVQLLLMDTICGGGGLESGGLSKDIYDLDYGVDY